MPALALKLLLSPSLVAGVTLAGRRWGPRVAGAFAGIPVVGGPILALIVLEHGPGFGRAAAVATTLGMAATAMFGLVYAWSARRLPWPAALLVGWAGFFAAALLLRGLTVGPLGAAALTFGVTAAALWRLPRPRQAVAPPRPPVWDLPLRGALTALLVYTVTTSASLLGPTWSGLLTPFPIVTTVLTVFAHAQEGADAAAQILRGIMAGLFAFVCYATVIALTLEAHGTAFALAAGAAACLLVNGLLFVLALGARRPAAQ
jgi:hypothetical protein